MVRRDATRSATIDADRYPFLAQYATPVKRAEREIVGRDHEIESLFAAFHRPELCNVILLAPAGSGKALENGTLIPVADERGFVPIEELCVGDRTFDDGGEVCRVQGVFPQGELPCHYVTFDDDTTVSCNEGHIWRARRRGEATWRELTLRELMAVDEAFDRPTWEIPVAAAVNRRIVGLGTLAERVREMADALEGGVMLPDGRHAAIVSKGAQLSRMRTLVASCGFRCDVVPHDDGSVLVAVRGDSEAQEAALSGKGVVVRAYTTSHDRALAVRRVERRTREVPMTCITVSSPHHVYLAGEDFVVTHNTALVQGAMARDTSRIYLEVDMARMIADLPDTNQMAARLKRLFDETQLYNRDNSSEIVLFMDEFHQVVQLSDAAVEALKPLLADSGTRGIRVIAATTNVEFRQYISSNQPLVERLQRINLAEPDRKTTVAILRGMARRYGVERLFHSDRMFELIYEYTERYIPANAQPRKSILVLDSMVGWHRATKAPLDQHLLAKVLEESEGVHVAFNVDATTIKKRLDERVFAQDYATSAIEERLQICVADLNDHTKPMSSFLFTGSTGVGKTEVTKQLVDILFGDDRSLLRFDMTEYSERSSQDRFRYELTSRVWARPYSIVLLDEIEKACGEVTGLLLQVLDDARLQDKDNREVSFKNCYIIMTTNAGSEVYETIAQYNSSDKGDRENIASYEKVIRQSIQSTTGERRFPPELLGRIDTIVAFQPLSEATMGRIVERKLVNLRDELMRKHGIELRAAGSDIIRYLIGDRTSREASAGGARGVVETFEREVTTAVARFINANPGVRAVGVRVEGDKAVDNKRQLKSHARIVVAEVQGTRRTTPGNDGRR